MYWLMVVALVWVGVVEVDLAVKVVLQVEVLVSEDQAENASALCVDTENLSNQVFLAELEFALDAALL